MITHLRTALACGLVFLLMSNAAMAQNLIETYQAQIDPVDRRNSSGVPLSELGAILSQDRANVHRFGLAQPGDTRDSVFLSREMRAALPGLLSHGVIDPGAAAALRSGGTAILQISIWGSPNAPSHITVSLAGTSGAPAEQAPISGADLAREAANIQSALNARGFDAGPVDGQPGQRTRNAIAAFQSSIGAPATGQLTATQLAQLKDQQSVATGPSFECSQATTVTELAICASPRLAALDRALATTWQAARADDASDALVKQQRQWVAMRDTCGAEAACLERAMSERITALGGQPNMDTPLLAQNLIGGAEPDNPMATATPTSSFVQDGSLIRMDDRLLWSAINENLLIVPQGREGLQTHAQTFQRLLTYAGAQAASDDLAAGFRSAPSVNQLRPLMDIMPGQAYDEIIRLGLEISAVDETTAGYCTRQQIRTRFYCATQRLATEFDRRRFIQGAGDIAARAITAEAIEMPVDVLVLCRLGRIDDAYDFDTGAVNWTQMIREGGDCRSASVGFSLLNNAKIEAELDLISAVPGETVMNAAWVEELARSYSSAVEGGQERLTPLMLSFNGQLRVSRTGSGEADTRGFRPIRFALARTGPVSLRSSGNPQDVIMTFEAPSADLAPVEAIDLSRADNAFALTEGALDVSAQALNDAAQMVSSGQSQRLVRLPVYPDTDATGISRLSVGDFFLTETPAQRIAAMSGRPLSHVGWTQLTNGSQGVPNTEVVLIFPSAVEDQVSTALDPEIFEAARQGASAFLIAQMSEPMRMQGAAGPALVAAVVPQYYEVQQSGIGGATKVVARLAPEVVTAAPQDTLFLPSAWWFVQQASILGGSDLDTQINAVFDRANLFLGDTFARLDAVAAARQTLDAIASRKNQPPWIAGGIALGPYDLDREAWPVQKLNIILPARDDTETRITRRVLPSINTRELFLPMPMAEARLFQEEHLSSQGLVFYAQIDVALPPSAGALNVVGILRQLVLFRSTTSRSQTLQISPAINMDEAIATFDFAADEPPAEPVAALPTSNAPDTNPQPAPTEPPMQTAAATAVLAEPGPSADATWPKVPDVAVVQSDWDILGLHTGMSLKTADAIIVERGGLLAAFEQPRPDRKGATAGPLDYQRLYIAGDGTEAIVLAAPGPEGPVLAVKRRLQLARGTLPFDTIRAALLEKYGTPTMQQSTQDAIADAYWVSGTPGARQALCRRHFEKRISITEWKADETIGNPGFDLAQSPAAWNWAISDVDPDYAEQMSVCGHVISYIPKGPEQSGGASFSMVLIDAAGVQAMGDALAGVPDASETEIDF